MGRLVASVIAYNRAYLSENSNMSTPSIYEKTGFMWVSQYHSYCCTRYTMAMTLKHLRAPMHQNMLYHNIITRRWVKTICVCIRTFRVFIHSKVYAFTSTVNPISRKKSDIWYYHITFPCLHVYRSTMDEKCTFTYQSKTRMWTHPRCGGPLHNNE